MVFSSPQRCCVNYTRFFSPHQILSSTYLQVYLLSHEECEDVFVLPCLFPRESIIRLHSSLKIMWWYLSFLELVMTFKLLQSLSHLSAHKNKLDLKNWPFLKHEHKTCLGNERQWDSRCDPNGTILMSLPLHLSKSDENKALGAVVERIRNNVFYGKEECSTFPHGNEILAYISWSSHCSVQQ